MDRLKEVLCQYKSIVMYLFFGVCTTLVNLIVYYLCAHIANTGTMPGTIIAWIAAVLFAYLTNRTWVFGSEETTMSGIVNEIIRFFGCRLATGVVDWLCMFIFATLLTWNDIIVKVGANILVIILNYVASKVIIFRKRK
ncbi:MAG: GtrA family protein [Lachnospiraceae bacterium]|nr:GtrA family protein [Lachnospiraceae bacterium]